MAQAQSMVRLRLLTSERPGATLRGSHQALLEGASPTARHIASPPSLPQHEGVVGAPVLLEASHLLPLHLLELAAPDLEL